MSDREETLKWLVQNGCFAADGPCLAARNATAAEQTRIAVRAALDALERQGFIRFVPPDEWPEYFEVPPSGAS